MADYPRHLPIHMESVPVLLDRALVSELRGGGVKMRRLFAGSRYGFKITHRGLTASQRTDLLNFLAANRSLTFTLYVPQPTTPTTYSAYTVIWTDSEVEFTDEGGKLSSCTLTMRAVS